MHLSGKAMEASQSEGDGLSEVPAHNHIAAAAAPAAAAAAPADLHQDAAAVAGEVHGDEDEIAEVDPQNRYYRCMPCHGFISSPACM